MFKKIGLGVALVALVVLASVWTVKTIPATEAQTGGAELTGWLWSSNIGWVSLNCSNTSICATRNFKVVKNTNDTLSGYGWSSNVGWVKFNPAGPYPTGGATSAHSAKFVGSDVKGWVRFCGPLAAGCDSTLLGDQIRGGWDGWVSLSGTSATSGAYGVKFDSLTKRFSGFSWGDLVVGWADFSLAACANCVITGDPVLTVNIVGLGRVTDMDTDDIILIDCDESDTLCTQSYPDGSSIRLLAYPAPGEQLLDWEWAPAGDADPSCGIFNPTTGGMCGAVYMDRDRTVTVTFSDSTLADDEHQLRVVVVGTGTVTGSGFNCTTSCVNTFSANEAVTLNADSSATWTSSLSGLCDAADTDCNFNMPDQDTTITVDFTGGVTTPTDLFSFHECVRVGGGDRCVMTINCDIIADCLNESVFSNAAQIVPNDSAQVINYQVFFPSSIANGRGAGFQFKQCDSADSESCTLVPTSGITGSYYLKVFKPIGSGLESFDTQVGVKATAAGITDQKIATFRFIFTGGVQD